jgi:hypothetical protein
LFFPFKFTLFFSGLPIFVSFLAYGNGNGVLSTFLVSAILFLTCPLEASCDIFLNFIASAALLGYLSTKNIVKGRKTWWYPESFLLQYFVLLSLFSVAFMSMVFYPEDVLLKASKEVLKILFKPNDPNAFLLQQYFNSFIKYSVGIGVLTKMFFTVLNLGLAHLFLKKINKNIRPTYDLRNLTMHNFLAILPLAFLTLARLIAEWSFVFSGLFAVGLFAPLLVGFQVIRRFSENQGNGARIIFYVALFILTLPTLALLVVLGIIDSFYPIKRTDS